MSRAPQIVAIGGAGFAPESELLLRFILGLTGEARPRVCFLPTATGDSREHIVRFYDAFAKLECAPSHLELFGAPGREPAHEHLLAQDAIHVGGGNTANMLAVWRFTGSMRSSVPRGDGGSSSAGRARARTAGSRRRRPTRLARSRRCATASASSRGASRPITTPSRNGGRPTCGSSPTGSRPATRPTTPSRSTSAIASSSRSSQRATGTRTGSSEAPTALPRRRPSGFDAWDSVSPCPCSIGQTLLRTASSSSTTRASGSRRWS